MGPVAGEVVGTELVSRVLPIGYEIVGPGLHNIPVTLSVLRIAIEHGEHGCQGKHVAAFLDGHVATIGLAVGYRIGTHVVGSKGLAPATALAVLEYTGHHGLLQLGVIAEEERGLGISKVYRINATVRVVLLREEQQVALVVLEQLVSGHDMAVSP